MLTKEELVFCEDCLPVYINNRIGKCRKCQEDFQAGVWAHGSSEEIQFCLRCADLVFKTYADYLKVKRVNAMPSTFMERENYREDRPTRFCKGVLPTLSEKRDTAINGKLYRYPHKFYEDIPGVKSSTMIPCDKCTNENIRAGIGKGDCILCLCCAATFV